MLGKGSKYAQDCFNGNFIGADYGIDQDLKDKLPDDWRVFNKEFIPVFLKIYPEKTKISAGLACGALWNISKGIKIGDIVLCPDGQGTYHIGEVSGDYQFHPGEMLPHRRPVKWTGNLIARSDMSESLRYACGAIGALSNISQYNSEIENFNKAATEPGITTTDKSIEDPMSFALEKHLEEFLIQNWPQTMLGKEYDIYEDGVGNFGQQYHADPGAIDILAISKDKKTLLVVELKKGRSSDAVVGQILRYMGFVKEDLADPKQNVKGVIICHEDDKGIRRALAMIPNVEFFCYEVSFKLTKV